MSTSWGAYLDEFHTRNAGITEGVLGRARDQEGAEWLAELAPAGVSVLDLACGSAPL